MKIVVTIIALSAGLGSVTAAGADLGPSATAPIVPLAAPKDRPYPGQIGLNVDASDVSRRIFHVHETISGIDTKTILLYPKWLPGTHAPEGPIDRLAGLKITAQGVPVPWIRDTVNVYAFHLHPKPGISSVDIEFDYLSPTSPDIGDVEMSESILALEWNTVVLYPAGYFARQVPVDASVTVPANWQLASALETSAAEAAHTTFRRVDLETLIDSPAYAGRYSARFDLDPGAAAPVHLNVFADRPELLLAKPAQLESYHALVRQAYALFGSRHYARYDFLFTLSDFIAQNGLEHHQSSENGSASDYFTDWEKNTSDRDLLPHEYTHSWNGKFRRPADLWTPSYEVPMQDSLLWTYEGQTQYWGYVLSARAGLWTRSQALEMLAAVAANADVERGRDWRPLQDTTNDEIINPRRPQSWRSWQRYEDYYREGALVWLDADTLIRERSKGKRSLDDFARSFFGIANGNAGTVSYSFDDIVKGLNAVEPYAWADFLHQRLESTDKSAPLEGLTRGGYKVIFNETPNDYLKSLDELKKRDSLEYSIGVVLNEKDAAGTLGQVIWDGPAFKAGLRESAQILAVNGIGYSAQILKDAISAAKDPKSPIELIVKSGNAFSVVRISYQGGLRYPHLVRTDSATASIDDILTARP